MIRITEIRGVAVGAQKRIKRAVLPVMIKMVHLAAIGVRNSASLPIHRIGLSWKSVTGKYLQ